MQNRSMEYQTGAVKCEGNRRLAPGTRVTVKYVGESFSGEYIAERVVHELSVSGGFTTEVYVKRNMSGRQQRSVSVPDSVKTGKVYDKINLGTDFYIMAIGFGLAAAIFRY